MAMATSELRQELVLWVWFFIGAGLYWLKRAYYLVTGPSPIAHTYTQFLQRCWIPLLVRAATDSIFFWVLFTPGFADKALGYLGWENMRWMVIMVTQFSVFAFSFGLSVDVIADFLVSKIPVIKDFLPQMPGPLDMPTPPPPANP